MSATVAPTQEPIEALATPAPVSPSRLFWRRLKRHRLAMAGGVMLVLFYGAAIVAGFLAPYSYTRQDRDRFFHPPTRLTWANGWLAVPRSRPVGGVYKVEQDLQDTRPLRFFVTGEPYKFLGLIPTTRHCFGTGDAEYPVYLCGTDQFGRDIFSRLLYGARISLSIGPLGILVSFSVALVLGGISGYCGGRTDNYLMRFSELIMAVPALYLIMAMRAAFPASLSSSQMYLLIIVILSFVRWASSARVIRGMVLSLRERQFVLAARALGQRNRVIILRHILPNTFSYVILAATLSIPYYILGEVVLSFLTVGIQEPEASWGNMLTAAQNTEYLRSFPWLLAPGAAVFLTVLAFNFLGDGLRDAVDPKT